MNTKSYGEIHAATGLAWAAVLAGVRHTVDRPNPTTPRMNQTDQGSTAIYASSGWGPTPGWVFNNSGGVNGRPYYYPGALSDNLTSSSTYYADPDGVVRPGMGAYTGGNSGSPASGGYPQADDSGTTSFNIRNSRPVMLNRPFRSVADMGYASRGAPWKNVDFFPHQFSGDAALARSLSAWTRRHSLCRNAGLYRCRPQCLTQTAVRLARRSPRPQHPAEDRSSRPCSTARSNRRLSTSPARMPPGAQTRRPRASDQIGSADMGPLASSLTALTAATPLVNRGESGHQMATPSSPTTAQRRTIISRPDRESAIRALADVSNTRTWNLLIDLIAQTGRYPSSAGKLDQFNVEGERRYWLHVAIDRYTGKVVSQSPGASL